LKTRSVETRITKLTKILHYHLVPLYAGNTAWTLTAWEMEKLAEETLGQKYMKTIDTLRRSLYTYIASLGAEWPAEEENHILLQGTYIEAAKALKALWLSLHLVHLAPAEEPRHVPPPEELYTIYKTYLQLRNHIVSVSKPVPFRIADRMLEVAAYVALLSGVVEPAHFEELGLAEIIADIIWVLASSTANA